MKEVSEACDESDVVGRSIIKPKDPYPWWSLLSELSSKRIFDFVFYFLTWWCFGIQLVYPRVHLIVCAWDLDCVDIHGCFVQLARMDNLKGSRIHSTALMVCVDSCVEHVWKRRACWCIHDRHWFKSWCWYARSNCGASVSWIFWSN